MQQPSPVRLERIDEFRLRIPREGAMRTEGLIYADYTAAMHLATWPESIFSALVFAGLFHTWERNPKDKRLSIPLIAIVVITVLLAILGLLFMGAA